MKINFNKKGTVFFLFEVEVAFRFACEMFCFVKCETFETGYCMLKSVSRNTKFREIRNIFSRNTKLVRMKLSRILYERNSSVNPSVDVCWSVGGSERTPEAPILRRLRLC